MGDSEPFEKGKEVIVYSKVREKRFSMPTDLFVFCSLNMSSFNNLMFTEG